MRDHGPTIDPDKVCWFDFESKSEQDLQDVGAYRYADDETTSAIILAWAIGREPVKTHTAFAVGQPLTWFSLPHGFLRFHDRALKDSSYKFAAHNAAFDRALLNYAVDGSVYTPPELVIDTAFQATASGLPPDLAGAAKAAGATHKVENGDEYINLFCAPGATATPQSHPEQWGLFCIYAAGDVDAMRSLFLRTRQLSAQEWAEYHAMERINERGIGVDVDFAGRADELSKEARIRAGLELRQLTAGAVSGVNNVKDMVGWLRDVLPPGGDGIKILTKREEEEDDYGTVTKPGKFSLTRARVEKLIPYCEAVDNEAAARVLNIRLFGGSAAPAKYGKILRQEIAGCVYGQYVPGGAAMTGRASSRGIQIQNLVRKSLPYEHAAIEAILAGCDFDTLAALGDDTPVMRKLGLLIRTVFVPRSIDNVFVGSDLSQIEARILRWLPDTPAAEKSLQIMRDCDADKTVPDIYVRAAAAVSSLEIADIDEELRQRGKVFELALGFGGGAGAVVAMGSNYGLYMPEYEIKEAVRKWRAANQWCVRFWGKHDDDSSYGLWGAANRALENPHKPQAAGRVTYIFLPGYLGGSLLCMLPSGRALTYRGIRYETVTDYDDDDNIIGKSRQLRFWKGRTRSKIWHGTLCENVVQAVAADVLRGILVRLEADGFNIRLHSHDEVLGEVNAQNANAYAEALRWQMRRGFEWSKGLPLMSGETIQPYYSKWKKPKEIKS